MLLGLDLLLNSVAPLHVGKLVSFLGITGNGNTLEARHTLLRIWNILDDPSNFHFLGEHLLGNVNSSSHYLSKKKKKTKRKKSDLSFLLIVVQEFCPQFVVVTFECGIHNFIASSI